MDTGPTGFAGCLACGFVAAMTIHGCTIDAREASATAAVTSAARADTAGATVSVEPIGSSVLLPGTDERPSVRVAWLVQGGETRAVDIGDAIESAVEWDGAVAALGREGSLWRVATDGRRTLIADGVVGDIAASTDGSMLVYVVLDDLLGDIHVRSGQSDRVVGRGFQSAGMWRFAPDGTRVAFVGATLGGVAGVHVAHVAGSQPVECLSNCGLRAGTVGIESMAPPPLTLEIDATGVRWQTGSDRPIQDTTGGAR